ncbi:hypothetical protein BGW80DRAFT_1456815 [Lactifluus volemus]|nr:hypothetical protein BGW80DRAFT_1456815 [Lactifluus volemus]
MNPQGEIKSLLTDGYIAWSFQNESAMQHFCSVLRKDTLPPLKPMSLPEREGLFLAVDHGPPPNIPPHISDSNGRDFWVLDRTVVSRGPVVPQMMPTPLTVSDVSGRSDLSDLQFPIFFEHLDGQLGLSLEAAAAGQCETLRNAHEYAQLGVWSTTHICIAWLGYDRFARQVRVRDVTPTHDPVTVATFAHRIGQFVDTFLTDCKPDPKCTSLDAQLWRIGDGGVQRSSVMIIGAVNPSAISWMPILQLTRQPSADYDRISDVRNRRIDWDAIFKLAS